jgi:hypothetical protein
MYSQLILYNVVENIALRKRRHMVQCRTADAYIPQHFMSASHKLQ